MSQTTAIMWFRQDLRLADNPALFYACEHYQRIIPIVIDDTVNSGMQRAGAASRLWQYHSIQSLAESLDHQLTFFQGDAIDILQQLHQQYRFDGIVWNRCYEPWRIARDQRIKHLLSEAGCQVHSFNGSLLWEPWQVQKDDGRAYRVFTPFYRKGCLQRAPSPDLPLPRPSSLACQSIDSADRPEQLLDASEHQYWGSAMLAHWTIGEAAAAARLQAFISNGLAHYKTGRDFPADNHVSQLSPHLHHGEISPRQIWQAIRRCGDDKNIDHFCSELGWREFSYSLLYHNPKLDIDNIQKKFDRFPWQHRPEDLEAWQRGMTGIPIVDAGMRQLWTTGWMHNRVRMIVGSFLVKNLLCDWRLGAQWFWDTLVDADLASNSASWQWIAGCGADAAPYFRIFNPITQGKKFDPQGDYIRQYLPELAPLCGTPACFEPWTAPESLLKQANIRLGVDYPHPIVDLKSSRQRALDAFKALKES